MIVDGIFTLGWFGLLVVLDVHRKLKTPPMKLVRYFVFGLLTVPLCLAIYEVVRPLMYRLWAWAPTYAGYELLDNFLFVGPIEELAKFTLFLLLTENGKRVREPLEGVIQAATVALANAIVFRSIQEGYIPLLWRN